MVGIVRLIAAVRLLESAAEIGLKGQALEVARYCVMEGLQHSGVAKPHLRHLDHSALGPVLVSQPTIRDQVIVSGSSAESISADWAANKVCLSRTLHFFFFCFLRNGRR